MSTFPDPPARALFERARQRAEQHARDELRRQLDGGATAGTGATAAKSAPRPPPKLAPRPPPRLAPSRAVRLGLPDGRQLRVAMTPAPARQDDLAVLSQVTADNDRRAFQALRRQGRALDELERAQAQLAERVADLEKQSDAALLGLLQRFSAMEQQMKTMATAQRSTSTAVTQQAQELRSQALSAQLQKVTAAVSSAQMAAFGEKGSLLATNNLLLTGNQLLWSFIEPLARFTGLDFGMSPSPITWLAPLGSLAVGTATVGRVQHVRFLADVTTLAPGVNELEIPLLPRIAPADRAAFARRTDVLVTVRAMDAIEASENGLRIPDAEATVKDGMLRLTLDDSHEEPVRITWLVDTRLGNG